MPNIRSCTLFIRGNHEYTTTFPKHILGELLNEDEEHTHEHYFEGNDKSEENL